MIIDIYEKNMGIVNKLKHFLKSKEGYLTMKSLKVGSFSDGKLSAIELKFKLLKIKFLEEYYLIYKYSYIAIRGFEDDNNEDDCNIEKTSKKRFYK